VTDHETSVLSSRLHRLADDLTPPLDVVGQVRKARERRRRQRRGRMALVAVATATAAVVLGTATAVDLLSTRAGGEVAVPGGTTTTAPDDPAPTGVATDPVPSSTPESAPTGEATPAGESAPTSEAVPASEAPVLPAGWEPRSFLGVTFAVPPGARMADYVNEDPPADSDGGPTFIWNGPHLGGEAYARVTVQTGLGEHPVPEDGRPVAVPGAQQAYEWYGSVYLANPADPSNTTETMTVVVDITTTDRFIHVTAQFAPGPEGEQMARDLIASIAVT